MSQQLNYLTELLKNVTDGTAARVGLVSSLFKRFLLTHLHDEHDKTVNTYVYKNKSAKPV